MKIRFVTSNRGKADEAQHALAALGHDVMRIEVDVPEIQADALEEVAKDKADRLHDRVPRPYFVEDAGLFIDALSGFPGVYSAYAYRTIGVDGILRLLDGTPEELRAAHFEAVVAYVDTEGGRHLFTGRIDGRIAAQAAGEEGFGFDPVFVPTGQDRTFAQMAADEKNRLSHRGRALAALAAHVAEASQKA